MQSTSVPPWHICYYPNPNRINLHHFHLPNDRSRIRSSSLKNQTHFTNNSTLYLNATNSCSKNQEKKQNKHSPPYPTPNNAFLEQLYASSDEKNHPGQNTRNSENKGSGEESEFVLTNMWWADFKAALGQRINIEGIVCAFGVFTRDRQLAVPHVAIPDIRYIDWCELRRRGFQGVVFDKDNTLTVPYSLTLWPPLGTSLEQCKSAFGDDIAVFSNSAGLLEYDPDGRKARALESAIGITVIRHKVKKPGGTAEEIERHFGCESSRLIMVGDRPFTDIVYGNRNSFLTILTEPLSLAEEPLIVKQDDKFVLTLRAESVENLRFPRNQNINPLRQVRKLEVAIANLWSRQGMKPPTHKLPPGALEFVRKPPPM